MHRSKRKLLRQKSVVKSKVPRGFKCVAHLFLVLFCFPAQTSHQPPEARKRRAPKIWRTSDTRLSSWFQRTKERVASGLESSPCTTSSFRAHVHRTSCYVLRARTKHDLPSCNNRNIDFGLIALWCYPGTLRFSSWARKSLVSRVLWYWSVCWSVNSSTFDGHADFTCGLSSTFI